MNLMQLRYFMEVAELRSLTGAARKLRVSQPALTRQVRLLEQELGRALFVRHHRGVQLTEMGMRFRDRIEVILRLIGEARAEIAKSETRIGPIRIGFPPSLGSLLVTGIAKSIQATMPHLRIQLLEGLSHLQQEWLLNDRVDLALMTALEPNPLLMCHPLCDEDIWMVSRSRLRAHKRLKFSIAEVAAQPLIQTNRDNVMRRRLEKVAHEGGVALDIAMEVDALPVIKDLVKAGVGCHVSPYSAVIHEVRRGELFGRPIEKLSIRRVITHRSDRPITQTVLTIIGLIKAELRRVAVKSDHALRPIEAKRQAAS